MHFVHKRTFQRVCENDNTVNITSRNYFPRTDETLTGPRAPLNRMIAFHLFRLSEIGYGTLGLIAELAPVEVPCGKDAIRVTPALKGRRILVVEDESLVAMLLETILEDMGCLPVGPASTVDEALRAAQADPAPDLALLDVNVAGQKVFPVAEALRERGVPIVFSTGYGEGGLPEAWRGHVTLQKPFTEAAVRDALDRALAAAAG